MNVQEKECKHQINPNCPLIAPKDSFKGSYCRECNITYMANHYTRNRERILALSKARYVPSGRVRGRPRKIVYEVVNNHPIVSAETLEEEESH